MSLAWLAIIWTALTRLRMGSGVAWALVLAAAAGQSGLQLYHIIILNTDFEIWSLAWVDHETLVNAVLVLGWLSFGALLAALLIGLRTGAPDDPVAPEGASEHDSGTSLEIAAP
jgi:hypothetical protein